MPGSDLQNSHEVTHGGTLLYSWCPYTREREAETALPGVQQLVAEGAAINKLEAGAEAP